MTKVKSKKCNVCGVNKDLDEFYSQNKHKANGEEYVYYHPECKECSKKRSQQWIDNNPEKYTRYRRKYDNKSDSIERSRIRNIRWRKNGGQSEWYENNKDTLIEYRIKRKNKKHDISEEEWNYCKKYFSYSCAYCGTSEKNAIEKYGHHLHMEHVDCNGSNEIDNCIPACLGCNSSKSTQEMISWFKSKKFFTEERLVKIMKWLDEDYKMSKEEVTR